MEDVMWSQRGVPDQISVVWENFQEIYKLRPGNILVLAVVSECVYVCVYVCVCVKEREELLGLV